MSKTVWIVNQYASTPACGLGGRHYYMAREMAKRGINVYAFGSSSHHLLREKPEFDAAFKVEHIDDFKFVWIKMPHYGNAHSKGRVWNWLLFPWRLIKAGGKISDKPDAILCSSPSPIAFLGAQRLARKFDARLVFEVRDIWPLTLTEIGGHSDKNPFIRFMQWVEDKAYRDADAVVSNLKNSVEHMSQRGMDPDKFTWVPNGFSLDEVSRNVPLNSDIENQLPKGKFVVGYTGTLGVANALDSLIEAAERIERYTDIVFVLVGSGKEKPELQRMVHEKRLGNVFFVDPIPKVQIQSMLRHFDVCYIGLTKDPLFRFGVSPNKLFDYLFSAKPIIYAIDSGSYKPVEEIKAGVQVPAEDPQGLVDAVLQLYQSSSFEREKMGINGRNAAVSFYEYGQLAETLAGVLLNP